MLESSKRVRLFPRADEFVVPGAEVARDFFAHKTPMTRWNVEGRLESGDSLRSITDVDHPASLYSTDVRAAQLFHHWIPWSRNLALGSRFKLSSGKVVKARNFLNAALISSVHHLDSESFREDELHRVSRQLGDRQLESLDVLKDVDDRGFTFYSNAESAKGGQLAGQPAAALLFHWKSLRRQVRVRGRVEPVTAAEADAYFASRARESRIGAWASDQSRPLESRQALEQAVARETARFEGGEVPRPDRWIGWRVIPDSVEFWRDRPFRLHDRMRFERVGDGWRRVRLQP